MAHRQEVSSTCCFLFSLRMMLKVVKFFIKERISRENAESNWQLFNELLESTPRGNFGNLGLYFDLNEIYPVSLIVGNIKSKLLINKINKIL